jgi:hypothetical protein
MRAYAGAGRNMLFHPSVVRPLPLAVGDPRLRPGKFNQGVSRVKNGVKRVWYWLLSPGGNSNSPLKRQDGQIN